MINCVKIYKPGEEIPFFQNKYRLIGVFINNSQQKLGEDFVIINNMIEFPSPGDWSPSDRITVKYYTFFYEFESFYNNEI